MTSCSFLARSAIHAGASVLKTELVQDCEDRERAVSILIPLVDLGQQTAWQPIGQTRYWGWAIMAAGWVLTTTVVAGATGMLRRAGKTK